MDAGNGDRARRDVGERTLAKLERIDGVWDKPRDGRVTFEAWVPMTNDTLSGEQRKRERRWFERVDANDDEKVTQRERIAWKLQPGRE